MKFLLREYLQAMIIGRENGKDDMQKYIEHFGVVKKKYRNFNSTMFFVPWYSYFWMFIVWFAFCFLRVASKGNPQTSWILRTVQEKENDGQTFGCCSSGASCAASYIVLHHVSRVQPRKPILLWLDFSQVGPVSIVIVFCLRVDLGWVLWVIAMAMMSTAQQMETGRKRRDFWDAEVAEKQGSIHIECLFSFDRVYCSK